MLTRAEESLTRAEEKATIPAPLPASLPRIGALTSPNCATTALTYWVLLLRCLPHMHASGLGAALDADPHWPTSTAAQAFLPIRYVAQRYADHAFSGDTPHPHCLVIATGMVPEMQCTLAVVTRDQNASPSRWAFCSPTTTCCGTSRSASSAPSLPTIWAPHGRLLVPRARMCPLHSA